MYCISLCVLCNVRFSCTLYLCTISIYIYIYFGFHISYFRSVSVHSRSGFPCLQLGSVLMVYQTIAVLFSSTVDLVSYATVNELVCRSRDLIETLEVQNSTPLCIFEGKRFALYKIILEYIV